MNVSRRTTQRMRYVGCLSYTAQGWKTTRWTDRSSTYEGASSFCAFQYRDLPSSAGLRFFIQATNTLDPHPAPIHHPVPSTRLKPIDEILFARSLENTICPSSFQKLTVFVLTFKKPEKYALLAFLLYVHRCSVRKNLN